MIRTENLGKSVETADGRLDILKNITLEIKAGDVVAIVGPSGSGKSTLLGLMAGLDRASQGEIWLAGQALSGLDEDERAALRAANVGFVFQSFHLLGGLTALENVMLPLELARGQKAASLARDYLGRVGLAQRLNHYPAQLSGGEQQRVALARAFAARPAVLFADEPTGNLDTTTGSKINDLLFELNSESDATLVLVTHEQRLAERCQRTLSIEGGELVSAI